MCVGYEAIGDRKALMIKNGKNVTLQWVGDISLNEQLCNPQYHRSIRESMAKLAEEAGSCDLRVGNWEAPIWGNGGVNTLKTPRLCTTKEAAECILPLGLDVVFLGNNHIYDCLEEGFENTADFLRENNIRCLGAGHNQEEASRPLILERRGMSLGFLNYVHRNTHPNVPSGADIFLNYFDEETAVGQIGNLSEKVDVVVAYLHWGEHELVCLPSPAQREFGRCAIEAGAMGYITKRSAPENLVEAISQVYNGGRYFSARATEALALRVAKGDDAKSPLETLSTRELQVLRRLAMGHTNREIALAYSISVKTVDTYRLRLLKKLNLRNNAELSLFAIQNKLIEA